MQQSNDATLISMAEAARRLGLNRSTLQRQVARGAIRSHGGMVRLAEVLKDRANNLDPSRGRRKVATLDRTQRATPPVASGDLVTGNDGEPVAYDDPAISAARFLAAHASAIVAKMAVEAGAPMRMAYALAAMVRMELMGAADDHFNRAGVELDENWCPRDVLASVGPNWRALAAKAGERVSREAWEAWTSALPWFRDDLVDDRVPYPSLPEPGRR
ncbi:hypothetical protein [Chelatococcus reniformis]|uniref:Helix-turn-helix domain-containing protein n=1 Tax=Chelatococcus reniformis TaxID=1494448 RepID=A0A916XG38_9HYPH|nr:hypothetical protein [Chelatococcus reniformis]GGC70793.1 hypothetical protein GCM10010994_31700 [Chelatococcus reniformis]